MALGPPCPPEGRELFGCYHWPSSPPMFCSAPTYIVAIFLPLYLSGFATHAIFAGSQHLTRGCQELFCRSSLLGNVGSTYKVYRKTSSSLTYLSLEQSKITLAIYIYIWTDTFLQQGDDKITFQDVITWLWRHSLEKGWGGAWGRQAFSHILV